MGFVRWQRNLNSAPERCLLPFRTHPRCRSISTRRRCHPASDSPDTVDTRAPARQVLVQIFLSVCFLLGEWLSRSQAARAAVQSSGAVFGLSGEGSEVKLLLFDFRRQLNAADRHGGRSGTPLERRGRIHDTKTNHGANFSRHRNNLIDCRSERLATRLFRARADDPLPHSSGPDIARAAVLRGAHAGASLWGLYERAVAGELDPTSSR
jgi:hypothetical protein